MTTEKKAFMAGFMAGYAKGQNDAGEGGHWLTPPPRDKAWRDYKTPLKKPAVSRKNDEDYYDNDSGY